MTNTTLIEQTAREYIERLVLTSEPLNPKWNRENYIFRKQPKWNYMDSCMIRALLTYSEKTDDTRLIDYAVRFVNSYVNENGDIPTILAADYNLDNICGGVNLIKLYDIVGDERYRLAYEKLYSEQLAKQPRLECGCYWHKAIYPRQMWLDGVYMALPFLAEYGKINNRSDLISDAVGQLRSIKKIMRDSKSGLYYHGYNETRDMNWADKTTGLSQNFWLRSNGWLCAGLVDLYEITEDSFCRDMLSELLEALEACMTEEHMLMQLPAAPDISGNYPETSGTLLYAYGAIKGYRLGAAEKKSADSGLAALNTVTERYIVRSSGIPVLKNICLMGGLGGANGRDGSAEYYLSERIVENEAKGIAPYLMTAAELYKK